MMEYKKKKKKEQRTQSKLLRYCLIHQSPQVPDAPKSHCAIIYSPLVIWFTSTKGEKQKTKQKNFQCLHDRISTISFNFGYLSLASTVKGKVDLNRWLNYNDSSSRGSESVPSIHVGGSHTLITAVPGTANVSGLCSHLHVDTSEC